MDIIYLKTWLRWKLTCSEGREVAYGYPTHDQFRPLIHADFMNMTKEQKVQHYNRLNIEGRMYHSFKEGIAKLTQTAHL